MTEPIRKGWTAARGLERPVVAIVGLDPSYSKDGAGGLCVLPVDGRPLHHRQSRIIDTACARWLGDAVAGVCAPGTRCILVAESTAFGGAGVARKLGMSVGAIELLLLDLNAIEQDTRIDVATNTWRTELRKKLKGAEAWKKAARDYVRKRFGIEMKTDEAEATVIACWGLAKFLDAAPEGATDNDDVQRDA